MFHQQILPQTTLVTEGVNSRLMLDSTRASRVIGATEAHHALVLAKRSLPTARRARVASGRLILAPFPVRTDVGI